MTTKQRITAISHTVQVLRLLTAAELPKDATPEESRMIALLANRAIDCEADLEDHALGANLDDQNG